MSENNRLPMGWTLATIGELVASNGVFVDGDWVESKDQDPQGNVRLIQLADIGDGTYLNKSSRFLTNIRAQELRCTFLESGDVLIARMPDPLGRACIFPGDPKKSVTAVDVCIVRTGSSGINHRWLMWTVNAPEFRNNVSKYQSGSTRKRISRKNLAKIYLPIPPLPEQHRIVSEIETQFTRLDASVAALKRVQANLKRYRASVLQAACEGRLVLTEAELARAEGRSYESADELLQRILQERRAKWEAEQLADMRSKGKIPKDDRWKSKYKEPVKPNTSELPELPEGWVWTTVEQLARLVTDGDHNPPKRVPSGIPHLTAKHIKRWQITFDNCTYITPGDFERTRFRFEPLAGDLIVTCVGTVGETAIVPEGITFSADRNLAGIRLVSKSIDNRLLQCVLSSPAWQTRMRQASGSTAQPHLYLGDLRALPVPMPPTIEQQRIIAEVERCLSVIDELEATIAASLKRADRLRQAILKRAFEGKLVPQDPTDEPASVLLERIHAEREQAMAKPKATRQKTNSRKPTAQLKATTPVQGELALEFRE